MKNNGTSTTTTTTGFCLNSNQSMYVTGWMPFLMSNQQHQTLTTIDDKTAN